MMRPQRGDVHNGRGTRVRFVGGRAMTGTSRRVAALVALLVAAVGPHRLRDRAPAGRRAAALSRPGLQRRDDHPRPPVRQRHQRRGRDRGPAGSTSTSPPATPRTSARRSSGCTAAASAAVTRARARLRTSPTSSRGSATSRPRSTTACRRPTAAPAPASAASAPPRCSTPSTTRRPRSAGSARTPTPMGSTPTASRSAASPPAGSPRRWWACAPTTPASSGNPGFPQDVRAFAVDLGRDHRRVLRGRARHRPGIFFHGTADRTVPYSWSADTVKALRAVGKLPVPGALRRRGTRALRAVRRADVHAHLVLLLLGARPGPRGRSDRRGGAGGRAHDREVPGLAP